MRSIGGNQRAHLLAADGFEHVARCGQIEDQNGEVALLAEVDGADVHDLQPPVENLVVGEPGVKFSLGVFRCAYFMF